MVHQTILRATISFSRPQSTVDDKHTYPYQHVYFIRCLGAYVFARRLHLHLSSCSRHHACRCVASSTSLSFAVGGGSLEKYG